MTVNRINDAAVFDQIDEAGWQKFVALLVHKLAPNGVHITAQDMEKFQADGLMLLTHGHLHSFEFKMVTPAEAERLTAHDATQRGRA